MTSELLGFRRKDARECDFYVPDNFGINHSRYEIRKDLVVPVRLKRDSVDLKWLKKVLEELGKKVNHKVVLDTGAEIKLGKMSYEKKEGIDLAIDFIKDKLSAAGKEAGKPSQKEEK